MKKDNGSSRSSEQGKNPQKKPLLASSLKINDGDASRLVGGIVEKGFSDQPVSNRTVGPSSAPRPTVLPFPVARHRSHGPYWNAMSDKDSRGGDNSDEEDDEDLTEYDPISVLANPVQRKEKKGLDFSKWQEIMMSNTHLLPQKQDDSKKGLVESKVQSRINEATGASNKDKDVAVVDMLKKQEQEESCVKIDSYRPELIGNAMEVDAKIQTTPVSKKASGFSSDLTLSEDRNMSIESQIDAENFARLDRMSADEVAEAQAEIMAKLQPELIQTLKKRGQEKLKRPKASSSDITISCKEGKLQHGKSHTTDSAFSHLGSTDDVLKTESKDRGGENTVTKPILKSSSLWDTWTKRVEGVREIRFTLDGNAVGSDVAQVLGTANSSGRSGYSESNVSERDYIRTDGDPGAPGYSIKEAVALCRSMVPGQRTLALHLIASVLNRALHNIQQNQVGCTLNYAGSHGSVDWEALWAFALGPEPELALLLRMCLDDNHNSVVLACAKVIQCVLSCDLNESYFDISEKSPTMREDVFTAPVFRRRPEIDFGFLHGGIWKYNTKPSDVLPFREDSAVEETEGELTIKDDIVVASQDIAAGLVRMGILPRILYLLETDPSGALEECLLSILVAIARHSPTCAAAIMTCQRLIETVVNRFIMIDQTKINPSKIKSVTLLKVLARVEKRNCMDFISCGFFQKMMWHLYRPAVSIEKWANSGREACRLSSALLVEQLRFWKVCIQHGYGISYFSDLFSAVCIWLNAPELGKLDERNVLGEYAAIAKEVWLVLESLTQTLPNFYMNMDPSGKATTEETESWSWSYVGPIVNLVLEWISVENIPYLSKFLDQKNDGTEVGSDIQSSTVDSLLWLISSVLHMLSGLLGAVLPQDVKLTGGHIPWLPDFVPKIASAVVKSGLIGFAVENDYNFHEGSSFLNSMCYLRVNGKAETSVASVCCLHGLVQVAHSIDKLIQLANMGNHGLSSQAHPLSRDDKILANGILPSAQVELKYLLKTFMKLVDSEWQYVQSVATFGRGGPTPGVGVGWGASGGGFFSITVLLAQVDARLLANLLRTSEIVSLKVSFTVSNMCTLATINSALGTCLIGGPREKFVVEKMFDFLFRVPVLSYLESVICELLHLKAMTPFGWKYEEEEYQQFGTILASHFNNRWLLKKKQKKSIAENSQASQRASKKGFSSLDTIHEEVDALSVTNQEHTSLVQEWAHQRLPLPTHWFLSPLSTISHTKKTDLPCASDMVSDMENNTGCLEVYKAGLFFTLGLEAMSSFLPSECRCFILHIPVVWKLHALSVILVNGMTVLEEKKTRDVYETLQYIYGQYIDESRRLVAGEKITVEHFKFQSDIHENYSSFIEILVEQFAAVSYGDLVFGRQIAIYLHRLVESPVKLMTWNTLSNARALELLPPLEQCIGEADGYLEPVEDDEKILEAYAKSWVSGALDRAATRRSAAFTLALHHLSSFIFETCPDNQLPLRDKLVKSLLRDYSLKEHHKGMMLKLVQYKPATFSGPVLETDSSAQISEMESRMRLLKDACGRNSSLLCALEKLEAYIRQEYQT